MARCLRVSASFNFSDLTLSLSLPLTFSLLLDLIKWQNIFCLFAGRLAFSTLRALLAEAMESKTIRQFTNKMQLMLVVTYWKPWYSRAIAWFWISKLIFTYAFLAFSFDTNDRLPFGFVHDYSPLIMCFAIISFSFRLFIFSISPSENDNITKSINKYLVNMWKLVENGLTLSQRNVSCHH